MACSLWGLLVNHRIAFCRYYNNKGEWIQAVSEEDAILAHLPQEELAKSFQRDILRAVTQYREEHSMQKRLLRIGE